MARYFFDLEDGSREEDDRGTNFPTRADAHDEAVRYLASIMSEDPAHLRHDHRRVTVRDANRRKLFEIVVYSMPINDDPSEGKPLDISRFS